MLRTDLFVGAQAAMFETACEEIRAHKKRTHWFWFVFPQLGELGSSSKAKLWGLEPRDVPIYLHVPMLADNYYHAVSLIYELRSPSVLVSTLGLVDVLKLRSSLTLFEPYATANRCPIVRETMERLQLEPCPHTLALVDISKTGGPKCT